MAEIKVQTQADRPQLEALGVFDWPVWSKTPSTFPWHYDSTETCYILEGDITVTPNNGTPVTFGKGDLVTFPAGLSCTWEIRQTVKKHYSFD